MATTKLIEVTLKKIHTHAGEELPVGSKIEVTPHEARFLLNQKVITEIPTDKASSAEKN